RTQSPHTIMVGSMEQSPRMPNTPLFSSPIHGQHMSNGATGWALLLFIGVGPGALTMTLFAYSVPRLGAGSFAILANVELVTVVLIGTLVLGEAVTPGRAIGGALIVAGILTHALARQAVPVQAPTPSLPRDPQIKSGEG